MDDEVTKEIKNLNEIENSIEETVEEEPEEKAEELLEADTAEEPSKEKNNKKRLLIAGGIIGTLFLIIILIILFHPKSKTKTKEEETNGESKFVVAVEKALQSGDFDQEIKRGLKENEIDADSVCLINMDLDSDGDQGIVVYAEGNNKRILMQLEVEEEVYYDDSFPMDSKESIGYAYSSVKQEQYWYTIYENNYTIISSAKKIIKEKDFLQDYYIITKNYKQKPILDNCISYSFDQNLDPKELEDSSITATKVLEDNSIKEEEIKDLYKKYTEEKEEAEKKQKEEEEKKEKEEEEQKKLSGYLELDNTVYRYGIYRIFNENEEQEATMILYSDRTCVYNETNCTYTVGNVRDTNDSLVTGISLSTGQTFIATVDEGVFVNPETLHLAKYSG